MKIEILGTGCPKCKTLTANVEKAVKEMGIEAEIVKVTKLTDIMNYGIMLTPALVIDGQVKSAGRVLTSDDIKKLIA